MILKHFSANLQRSLQLVWSIVENGFKVILSSYQIFWAFEKGISHSNRDEVQIVFQEREAKLSRPLLMGSILENGLKANFRSYSISRAFQNRIFHFFADFSATKWGKWGKLSKKSKIFKFDGFEATLRSKANVVNLVKCFWSNLFWRNLPRKWFWSYLELKNECYESLKTTFFSFLQVFEWRNWNHFLGKWGKAFKTS